MNSRTSLIRWLKITVTATVLAMVTAAGIHAVPSYEFATPIFKLAVAPDGSLLVADAGAGIVELRNGVGSLVAANTGSALQTGLVALATFAPQSIACPVGGLLADRFDRRKVFATALMVQALVTTALAVTLGLGVREPGVLFILILLASAAGATGAPSFAAMQPVVVPPE